MELEGKPDFQGLKACGMKAGTFVIDAKWEGKYGLLEHSAERFPHFEEILARIHSDSHFLGVWAAFMRCEDPKLVGLTTAHMLCRPNGEPITINEGPTRYYSFDFTPPEVQQVLRRSAKAFMKRYRPDLVKFDFGYELPSLDAGTPKDLNWAGEKLLAKGLDVVVNAMREENPDLEVQNPRSVRQGGDDLPLDRYAMLVDLVVECFAESNSVFASLVGGRRVVVVVEPKTNLVEKVEAR